MISEQMRMVKILLVEDNLDNILTTQRALKEARIINRLWVTRDGQEALDFLLHRGRYQDRSLSPRPGLILLDINLPKVSGLEVLRVIKRDQELKKIPTVVLTVSKRDEDVVKSYEYGCNSFIQKPLEFERFVETVKQIGLYWGLLNIPLISQGKVIGIMYVADKISGDNFTERDLTVLSVVAGQATIAIENANLYGQLQNRIVTLQQTIDELHRTQEQLIQSEKMSAMGRLAFGIAHEIRNPLATILGGVEFLKQNLKLKDNVINHSLKIIDRSTQRINKIITNLLEFSRPSSPKMDKVNICRLLEDTINLFYDKAKLNNVKIKKEFSQKDVFVNGNLNMLQQAFFNLCINAIEAMPKGGVLTLKVFVDKAEEGFRSRELIVEVKDTGSGISKENLSKIFDPFFTTKQNEKGTGLGLSIVNLIFKKHNANVEVKSIKNKGTGFIIRFPLV